MDVVQVNCPLSQEELTLLLQTVQNNAVRYAQDYAQLILYAYHTWLMEQLDPDRFFRTNRQTIVQIDAIVRIEPYFLNKWSVHTQPEHDEKILVSKEKYASFRAWLNF